MKNNTQKLLNLRTLALFCSLLFFFGVQAQKTQQLTSPNGKIGLSVSLGDQITYTVSYEGEEILSPSRLAMQIDNSTTWGEKPKLQKVKKTTVNEAITSHLYKKTAIKDHYNQILLSFKGDYHLVFRVYDDGVAYRFISTSKKPFVVHSETVEYVFPNDAKAFVSYVREDKTTNFEKQFFHSFETTYNQHKLSEWDAKKYAFSPLLVESTKGKKICLVEADLLNYPGMYLYNGEGSTRLQGVFANLPDEVNQGGYNQLQGMVKSRKEYLATFDKGGSFPWRAMVISAHDYELANNDMVYKLASPAYMGDFSWVKPGKVAWDWWNSWNLYGVDFVAGIDNQTYKYYIDFASQYGIEYVILDEGWSVKYNANLLQVVPEINLPELVAYANSKQVGLILWAGYYAFERDMETVCKHYSNMGIKGFKIDFMDRDDQLMVDFHRRASAMCAKYQLVVDFHGTYKPTGLQRTYPNVLNFEGVHGLEQLKWAKEGVDQVTYDVCIPFIRMVAGPMDYTQGAMRNAIQKNFRAVHSEAMSQGTRCRQLAQYIIFESPLNMMCDNPSNYMAEKECTQFIAGVPTVWDQTRALAGEVGKYVSIARQKGDTWYVGALTNWDARDLDLDLSFLGEGNYQVETFQDGLNAHRVARDYKKQIIILPNSKKITISMAPGGGWAARIYKI